MRGQTVPPSIGTTQTVVAGTLADIGDKVAAANLPGPALIMIGSVVTMRGKLGVEGIALDETHQMELAPREGL